MRLTRRRFLLAGAASVGIAGLGYARLVEPGWLELVEWPVTLRATLSTPVRVLYLSDLHWSHAVPARVIAAAVTRGLAARPDVICLGGDYVTAGDDRPTAELVALLEPLAAAAPCYAVLGNHDGGAWSAGRGGPADPSRVVELLSRAGIRVLQDEAISLPELGLTLVGLRDLWSGQMNPAQAFASAPVYDGVVLALAHNPDTKHVIAGQRWSMMLSGHTHGGQIVVPLIGPPYAPVADRRYIAGLRTWDSRPIVISRGVGNLSGWRFNCRPEITVIALGQTGLRYQGG